MKRIGTKRLRLGLLIAGGALLALMLAVAMQRTLVEQIGGWIGGLWVSIMEIVLQLVRALVGG